MSRSSPGGSGVAVVTLEILRRMLHTHSGGLSAVAAVSEAQECWSSRIKRFCESYAPKNTSVHWDGLQGGRRIKVGHALRVHHRSSAVQPVGGKSQTTRIGFDLLSSDTRASCQIVDPHNPDFGEQLSPSGQSRLPNSDPGATPLQCARRAPADRLKNIAFAKCQAKKKR